MSKKTGSDSRSATADALAPEARLLTIPELVGRMCAYAVEVQNRLKRDLTPVIAAAEAAAND